ncbi:mycothiol synthase [Granulicoccus sp. GXG6511]|uniref:mycothiol synthase n=1 Tax=Granulicoccus sp. GXG6511 TaxID=3381351 RepID=UPI003D7CBCCA
MTATATPIPETVSTLSADQRLRVQSLIAKAQESDGVAPCNEAAMLEIGRTTCDPGTAHQLCRVGDELAGYCFLDHTTDDPVAQLVVDPEHRRRGVATAMIRALGFDPRDPDGAHRLAQGFALRMWSFGDLPAARALTTALGYQPVRELLVMARALTDLSAATLPDGVKVRAFAPEDLPDLVRVNARAFAHHPEQGAMTDQDFRERMAEPWFDPTGLLIATREDKVVGFHWTKRHDAATGEVYVIGVDPAAAGGGVGRALLHLGLAHLADGGAERVILYVEGDQRYVVDLYESTGFEIANRDIMYSSPTPETA